MFRTSFVRHGIVALSAAALLAGVGAPGVFAKAKAAPPPLVRLESTKLGEVLANEGGYTLYWFTPDHGTHLACQGVCAKIWPPLVVPASEKTPVIPKGVPGRFGVVARGKARQLTWNGHPLYTFVRDKAPGQVNGEGFKKLWWAAVVKPAPKPVKATKGAAKGHVKGAGAKTGGKASTGGY
jgi:predicted lipoprotein with Yx(FWY)xxD motif